MRNKSFQVTLFLFFLFGFFPFCSKVAFSEGKAEPKKIEFQKGKSSAVESEIIQSNTVIHEYLVTVRAGQHLIVNVTPKKFKGKPLRLSVCQSYPDCEAQKLLSVRYEAKTKEGDYLINVSGPKGVLYRLQVSVR